MFERAGKVTGFERSAIRFVKPDGNIMIIAYSSGSEVKSVRVEPLAAVASLVVLETRSGSTASNQGTVTAGSLGEVFEKLYRDARKELEERLAKIELEPANKTLRLNAEEEARYVQVSGQMEGIVGAKYGFNPRAEDTPISFWGLEKRPYELQLDVVKIRYVRFLRMVVGPRAEKSDIVYSTDEVWPEDWPRILDRFGLGSGPCTLEAFKSYVNYLRSNWKYRPTERRPVLVRS